MKHTEKNFYVITLCLTIMFVAPQLFADTSHIHHKDCHQKPGAAVVVSSPSSYDLEKGELKKISIELSAHNPDGVAEVSVRLDAGLSLLSNRDNWQFELSEKTQLEIPLTISAAENGRYFVHIFTHINTHDGQLLTRAQAVVINVGEQAKPIAYKTQSIEPVIMHAQESIH